MLCAAALLLVAGELWTASVIRGLRETEDVRDAPAIEQAFARRLAELERFPLDLAPTDLEAERYCQVDVERANLLRRADFLCSHRTAQVTSCQTMKARSRSSR